MAPKRRNGEKPKREIVRRRRLPAGACRSLHITLPLDAARRLEKIAIERNTTPSVVVLDLVERCPIRPGGDGEPAADGPA
jgi:hypothetical protein